MVKKVVDFKENDMTIVCNSCGFKLKECRKLYCEHSPYCVECLKKLGAKGKILCSECCEWTDLKESGIDGLEFDREKEKMGLNMTVDVVENVFEFVKSEDEDFYILENKFYGTIPNNYLRYIISKENCIKEIETWIDSIWLKASDLKETFTLNDLKSYYVPFFVFSFKTKSHISGKAFKNQYWAEINDEKIHCYQDHIVCGSFTINNDLVKQLLEVGGSFSYSENSVLSDNMRAYVRNEISNDYHILDIDFDETTAWDQKSKYLENIERENCNKELESIHGPSNISEVNIDIEFFDKKHNIILLPIFCSSYDYNKKTYEVIVSGFNGKVVGFYPGGLGGFSLYPRLALRLVQNAL